MNDVLRMLNDAGLTAEQLKLTPLYLAEIIKLVDAGTINISTGKTLLEKIQASGKSPAEIVQAEGLAQGQRRRRHPGGVRGGAGGESQRSGIL